MRRRLGGAAKRASSLFIALLLVTGFSPTWAGSVTEAEVKDANGTGNQPLHQLGTGESTPCSNASDGAGDRPLSGTGVGPLPQHDDSDDDGQEVRRLEYAGDGVTVSVDLDRDVRLPADARLCAATMGDGPDLDNVWTTVDAQLSDELGLHDGDATVAYAFYDVGIVSEDGTHLAAGVPATVTLEPETSLFTDVDGSEVVAVVHVGDGGTAELLERDVELSQDGRVGPVTVTTDTGLSSFGFVLVKDAGAPSPDDGRPGASDDDEPAAMTGEGPEMQDGDAKAGPRDGAGVQNAPRPLFRVRGVLGARAVGADVSSTFNPTITSNKDTYTAGDTAIFGIAYDLEGNSHRAGDYVVVTLPSDMTNVRVAVGAGGHFTAEDQGDGVWHLVLNEGIENGLQGSFQIIARTDSDIDEVTDETIQAGNSSKTFTVVPGGDSVPGVGTYSDEALMKDGLGNEGITYLDYDYSEADPAQIGVFDSTIDQHFAYRLYVNRKNVSMKGVVVTDMLPDGMQFDGGADMVTALKMDATTMTATTEEVPCTVTIVGNKLTVGLGDIDYPVELSYRVFVPAQANPKLRNHSEIMYEQEGKPYHEQRDYIAQGADWDASFGVKSVDKTMISADPADQTVIYTIKFWNAEGFETGAIRKTDVLDRNLTFLYPVGEYTQTQDGGLELTDKFSVTCDSDGDDDKVHITNTQPITRNEVVYVSFAVDFSRVPEGYTVKNTIGGNTATTTKLAGGFALTGRKRVIMDGQELADLSGQGPFEFELLDPKGDVIQMKTAGADGRIDFDEVACPISWLGKTMTYTVREKVPEDTGNYVYDDTVYTVEVTPHISGADDQEIDCDVVIRNGDEQVEGIEFTNKVVSPSPSVTPSPEVTPTPEITPTPSETPTPSPEAAPTPEVTPTPEVSPTPDVTPTPTLSPEETPTPEVTPSPTAVPVSPSPTATPTAASGAPKVEAHKSVDKSRVQAGDVLNYTITVKNKGTGDAVGVTVKDFVPDCTTYVSCGGGGSGHYGSTAEGREFATWFIDNLPVGGTASLTMTVKVNECNDVRKVRNKALHGIVGKPDRPSDGDTPSGTSNEVSTTVVSSGSRSTAPAGSTRSNMPKTGDEPVGTSVITLLLAGATLVYAGGRRRRKSR